MNLLGTGNDAPPLIVHNDPFQKKSVSRIYIVYDQKLFTPRTWYWQASVSFRNGNTTGEHKTKEYDDYADMMIELQTFLNSLK